MTHAPYPIYLCMYICYATPTHTLDTSTHTQMDDSLFEGVQATAVQSVEPGVVCEQVDSIGQGVLRLQLKGAFWKGRGRCEVGQVVCIDG